MDDWITETIESMGYPGLVWLMFLENIVPPIPSELVMPLAGYLVAQERFNVVGVILAGTLGSMLGAVLLYGVGRWLGEERLCRFAAKHGRWLTLSPQDIGKVSDWFDRRGGWAVFVGRLVPGIRSLISIPAGVHAMPLPRFLIASTAGTLIWTTALVLIGRALGENHGEVGRYLGAVTKGVMGLMLAIYVWRVVRFDPQRGGSSPT